MQGRGAWASDCVCRASAAASHFKLPLHCSAGRKPPRRGHGTQQTSCANLRCSIPIRNAPYRQPLGEPLPSAASRTPAFGPARLQLIVRYRPEVDVQDSGAKPPRGARLGLNELSGANLRTEADRKQPNVRRHADAISPGKWPYTQDGALLRELCLDNDDRLFSAILQ